MTLSKPHVLQPSWELAGSQIKAKALEIALSKSVFDLLLEPCSAEHIAQQLSLDINNTRAWLELLWSMEYVKKSSRKKNQIHYANSKLAMQYFVSNAAQNCSQAVLFRLQALNNFANQFEANLTSPPAINQAESNMANLWAKAAQSQILQEQKEVTVPALMSILNAIDEWGVSIPDKMHFLDLGAGPGLISLALAERYPKSTGVVFDLPETTKIAQDNLTKAGVEQRIAIQSGDLNDTLPTGQFDLIWCSSVLHFLDSPADLLKHIESILKPNGILLILHAEHTADKALCQQVLSFYLPMLMKGNYLPKTDEIPNGLQSDKMTLIKSEDIICFPMAPVKLHCVRKLA